MKRLKRSGGLILLDRDGVLNEMVIDSEHGTIDSPLHPDQVRVFSWVPQALVLLEKAGFALAIVTNQPSAAKLKTTRENLEATHAKVISLVQSEGATICSSHICFHRAEDGCTCRKPKTGLLEAAFSSNSERSRSLSWMVGDGITDVQAGASLGLQTAFIGPQKQDAQTLFYEKGFSPTLWCRHLSDFAERLLQSSLSDEK